MDTPLNAPTTPLPAPLSTRVGFACTGCKPLLQTAAWDRFTQSLSLDPSFLKFPKHGRSKRGRTQKDAKENDERMMSANASLHKSAEGLQRALPRKKCKQAGLKQQGLGTPKAYKGCDRSTAVMCSCHIQGLENSSATSHTSCVPSSTRQKAVEAIAVSLKCSLPLGHSYLWEPLSLLMSRKLQSINK